MKKIKLGEKTLNMHADFNFDGVHGSQHVVVLEIASQLCGDQIDVQKTLHFMDNTKNKKFTPDIIVDGKIVEVVFLGFITPHLNTKTDKTIYVLLMEDDSTKKCDFMLLKGNYSEMEEKWRRLLK